METLFLYLFLVLCLYIVVKVAITPALIFEYPYIVGCIFCIFILPQSIILYNKPHKLPPGALLPLLIMAFLCLLMTILGYYLAPSIKLGKVLNVKTDPKKLKQIGIIFMVLGYLFLYLMERELAAMGDVPSQWTGTVTIYFQLFQVMNIAFPIFLYLTIQRPSVSNIILSLIAIFPFVRSIIVAGRREVTAFFILTIAYILFFKYKLVPPRFAIIGAIIFATLFIPATSDYRALSVDRGPLEAIQMLDMKQSFINYYDKAEYLELEVAANMIDSYLFHGEYEWGWGYWDNMVFRWVPAQIVGYEFKQSLMMSPSGTKYRNGYRPYMGLTSTGLGDSFKQLGFLGCFFFFFLGGFFRSMWRYSLSTESPLVQFFYAVCVVQSLLTVTHGTSSFAPGIFFSFLCFWITAWYAKVREA